MPHKFHLYLINFISNCLSVLRADVARGDEMLLHVLCMVVSKGCSYPTSGCRDVDVSVNGCIPRPSSSALDEYHIPRALSLVTSENLDLLSFSDKNMDVVFSIEKALLYLSVDQYNNVQKSER